MKISNSKNVIKLQQLAEKLYDQLVNEGWKNIFDSL